MQQKPDELFQAMSEEEICWSGVEIWAQTWAGSCQACQGVRVKVTVLVIQLYPTLCNPVNGSPPTSSARGILQARILEWVAMPSSRGSS